MDEFIQWITPLRFWELKDIWLNAFSVALTQVAIAKGLQPSIIAGRPSMGKTAFALNIAEHVAVNQDIPVGFDQFF